MAECILLRGGGADLDAVTAGKPDVLAGKVIVNKDGEPLTGTMPNRGSVSQALNAGGSYVIPEGYHSGAGKVTANSLASQTPGNADPGSILSGRSAWVNGSQVGGAIPWQNAETDGDRVWATNASNWEGTINVGVRNGHYLNGVNWVRYDMPNYWAGNIKKGVNMGGVVGTFEGYVPTPTDLYLRGNNIAGWYGNYVTFDAGQISFSSVFDSVYSIDAPNINLVGFNQINFEIYKNVSNWIDFRLSRSTNSSNGPWQAIGAITVSTGVTGAQIVSFNLQSLQIAVPYLRFSAFTNGPATTNAIYRIWLS